MMGKDTLRWEAASATWAWLHGDAGAGGGVDDAGSTTAQPPAPVHGGGDHGPADGGTGALGALVGM